MRFPWKKRQAVLTEEYIGILSKGSDEYNESVAFRLARCLGCLLELRKYSTSEYKGHKKLVANGDDRQWINVVTCPRDREGYRVVMSGASCGLDENPFKSLLERLCDLFDSPLGKVRCPGVQNVAGSGSVQELDLKLAAAGY